MVREFLVILLVIFSLPTTLWALTIDEMKAGVVKISARVDGKTKIGTGFIVSLDPEAAYIVTASHVVEGTDRLYVAFFTRPNSLLRGKTIGLEGGDPKGLAVLLVEGNMPPNVLALKFDRSVTVGGGENINAIGFPRLGEIPWAVTSGTIIGPQGRYITFTGAVDEGNSGGPLIKNGLVIGVITEIIEKYNYAQPADTVESFLRGWRVGFSDDSDKRLVQDAINRFAREQRIIVHLTEQQSPTLLYFLKQHGEYWGQVYLGLSAFGTGLVPRDTEESRMRCYLVLDAAAQVWAGNNLSERMLKKTASDALKEFNKIIEEVGRLDDQGVLRVRGKALKDKEIYIKAGFGSIGPRLRPLE